MSIFSLVVGIVLVSFMTVGGCSGSGSSSGESISDLLISGEHLYDNNGSFWKCTRTDGGVGSLRYAFYRNGKGSADGENYHFAYSLNDNDSVLKIDLNANSLYDKREMKDAIDGIMTALPTNVYKSIPKYIPEKWFSYKVLTISETTLELNWFKSALDDSSSSEVNRDIDYNCVLDHYYNY